MDALLALDLGTSGCRAEIFSLQGQRLAGYYCEYGLLSPVPGAAEQEPQTWLQALGDCVRSALSQLINKHVQILAIGISAQGHSWLPVNKQLEALRPALTWLDTRATDYARMLLEKYGVDFWGRLAGKLPGPWHMLPQLLWLRDQEAYSVQSARYFLCAHDYLLACLTGEIVTEATNAATTLLFNIVSLSWEKFLLDEWEIEPTYLPRLSQAGTIGGFLRQEIASQWGLPAKIPVAVGAQDQKCAALAAGLQEGVATASLGTATAISALTPKPCFSLEQGAIPCFPYLWPGSWILEAPLTTTGGALCWLRNVLCAASYETLIADAENISPGSSGVLFFPYLAGAGAPFWRPELSGAFMGLSLACDTGHLTRALLEAVAYDIYANLEFMNALGSPIERLVLYGGGARSLLWPQIIAAVCGLPTVTGSETEAASRGAAMLAAQAIDIDPAPLRLSVKDVLVPAGWREAYQPLKEFYAQAREAFFLFVNHLKGKQKY